MNENNALLNIDDIQCKIYTLRGVQIMFDEDLATLYDVETKVLNQAVKRNIDRFPKEFMFQLTENEIKILRSQIVTSRWGGRRSNPYAFTEQGVAMLSAVLRSKTAINVSIKIINAFVAMRRFISLNAQIFQRLDTLEIKQHDTDKKIDVVLNAIESREIHPKQGIFFDGQIFDAYNF
ncbi:MAG: ORF6N domain-containing protein, partial [Candidatus Aenigmarchaeota archaeon]|nr:ORF6N domain-containing protein [Candidatus Aenigmarchaeota archaeon]